MVSDQTDILNRKRFLLDPRKRGAPEYDASKVLA